ncbi:unnamed protein product [Rotaria sp. Silwood2]|nr:unnamed protein product [Rotaria sp. Silwood2]
MKPLLILCVLFGSTFCAPICEIELDQSWELFKQVYGNEYASIEEETTRRIIWETNLDMIDQHNLKAGMGVYSYTLKMNQFGDMTNEEFNEKMNGFKIKNTDSSKFDRHTHMVPQNFGPTDYVDWRTKGYVTSVKDQGQCGSCWAFSATGALEGQHFRKTKSLISLSEQNLIDCSSMFGNMGCEGGLMDSAFQYIKVNKGIDTESSYSYEAHDGKCRFTRENVGAIDTGFVDTISHNETDLEVAIATIGPISVAVDASHSSFQFYSSGIYDEPDCSDTKLNHGMLAVGYNDTTQYHEYYIVKNSWGTSWGMQGYIWMRRNYYNQCGIATMASYPLV